MKPALKKGILPGLVALLMVFALVTSHPVLGQGAPGRVALVLGGTAAGQPERVTAFRQRMAELGHVDGKGIVLDIREIDGQFGRLPEIMRDVLASRPAVIVVAGSQSVGEALKVTSTIPIVAATVADPVEQGFAKSLARPGRNLTGNALIQEVSEQKALEILREMRPKGSRVAILLDADSPNYLLSIKRLERAVQSLNLKPVYANVSGTTSLESAIAMAVPNADMVLVGNDARFNAIPRTVVELLARHRIPVIYPGDSYVEHGGLASYGYSIAGMFRNAANFVDQILKGRRPAEIPFEQPLVFDLTLNLKTAKALNMTIPDSVQVRAARIIE